MEAEKRSNRPRRGASARRGRCLGRSVRRRTYADSLSRLRPFVVPPYAVDVTHLAADDDRVADLRNVAIRERQHGRLAVAVITPDLIFCQRGSPPGAGSGADD